MGAKTWTEKSNGPHTFDNVTVLSVHGIGRGATVGTYGAKVLREAMQFETAPGDRTYWTEYWLGNEQTISNPGHKSTWLNALTGDTSKAVVVDLAVTFIFNINDPQNRTSLNPIRVEFGPGETEKMVFFDRPDPERQAYAAVSVQNPRWAGENGGQRFLLGVDDISPEGVPEREMFFGEPRQTSKSSDMMPSDDFFAGVSHMASLNELLPYVRRSASMQMLEGPDRG
ncbi:hypothetical protein ABZ721_33255 [Streptomyces sp. NPDC006733]|uniref:hypothetical protein n=1 Tax=Streptomyces sp. NPDC006733 TaxID=3155460 RepID=UPI0033F39D29